MTISELKIRAKDVLKSCYWMAFLATFLNTILVYAVDGVARSITSLGQEHIDYQRYFEYIADGDYTRAVNYIESVNSNPVLSLISYLLSIAVTLCFTNILVVGLKKTFINAGKTHKVDIGDLFVPFKHYGETFKTMFFHFLYIFLWSLLFIIPGIVKSYSYFMVPFILAENPKIDTARAFDISKKAMDGEKAECFLMHLSFIGWYLLGLIACCIGMYFVEPYLQTTNNEFYLKVKNKALASGIATPEDFGEMNVI